MWPWGACWLQDEACQGNVKRCGLGAALLPAQQVQHHTQVDHPRQAPQPLPKYGRIWVQDMPAKCCPAPCTFKARAEGLAQLKPAQAASCVWCQHGRQRTDPAVFIAVDDLNLYYGNAGTACFGLETQNLPQENLLAQSM